MSDEDEAPQPEDAGMPGWVMTFADLMSLLMCFFVLLLSFSEMDLQKYKQVAGSMEKAFGVQRDIKASDTPRGTSIIMQEFSPGRPQPTPLNEVRQMSSPSVQEMLRIEREQQEATESDAGTIAESMIEEIVEGLVELETKDNKIVIRILEKGSFPSGSATLRPTFIPVVQKISDVLITIPGLITVAGFTDDIPIATDRFRSNWELSSGRAVSVIEELLINPDVDPGRFVVSGFAETRPLVPNDTPENRAKNRRVELIIEQGQKYENYKDGVYDVEDESDTEQLEADFEEEPIVEGFDEDWPEEAIEGQEGAVEESGEGGVEGEPTATVEGEQPLEEAVKVSGEPVEEVTDVPVEEQPVEEVLQPIEPVDYIGEVPFETIDQETSEPVEELESIEPPSEDTLEAIEIEP